MGLLQKKWEYPECRQDGFYQSKQCTLSNNGTVDVCKCVDQNGEELSGLDSDANDCPQLAGVTENMGKGPQFVDNLKSIIDTHPSLKSAIQQLAGLTENMGKGPQFVDNLKSIIDTNLEHGAHGPSKPSSSWTA